MRKRPAARLGRALLVLPVVAVSPQLLANTGVQIPLNQYQAGAEQTTQVNNGNFSSRADGDANGSFETATGWNRVGNLFVNPTVNPPANAAATNPYSAQAQLVDNAQPPALDFNAYTQPVDRNALTPNANYVISAYIWNMGRHDTSGNGAGDLVSLKIWDTANITNNVSATLEGNGLDGQSSASGRLMYIMVNEAQMRAWAGIELAVTAEVGTISVPDLPQVWAQWDNVSLTRSDQFAVQKWVGTSGGSFGDANQWQSGQVPDGAGSLAALIGSATPQTVTNGAPRTLGVLRLGGSGSFTLDGAAVTLDVTADGGGNLQGLPEIAVDSGSHTVAAPVTMAKNGLLNVATGANLQLTANLTTNNVSLTKLGGGTATVTNVRTGTAGLAVDNGTLKVAPDAGPAGVSKVNALAIGPNARLDLTNNKLVTGTPVGTFTGGPGVGTYDGVQGQVQRAYNFGAWDQPGLTTSMPNAGQNAGILSGTETIGVATAEQVMFIGPTETGVFQGQTVTGATTIAMYTYAGDMNFDGLVDGADYGIIDNSVQFPGTNGYAQGDLNYDGVVDGADYGIIDNTVQLQGAPFAGVTFSSGAATIGGVAPVPEPTWIGTGAIALLALRRRARRPQ